MKIGRRGAGVALALLTLVGVALVVFDEAWIRPLAQRYVRTHAGRSIDFARIAFRLDAQGRPVLRLHDLMIENAAWAAPEPLIRAGLVEATFGWESLRSERLVVEHLRIADASLDLERQADGLRNFRIANPQDRGPGRVRIRSIDAARTRLRFVHQGLGLELELRSGPLQTPAASVASSASVGPGFTRTIVGRGRRDGLAFEARFDTGDRLSLYDTGIAFPLRGELRTAHARIEVDGSVHDLLQLAGFDLRAHATGESGAGLGEIVGVARGARRNPAWLPHLASDAAAARVLKEGPQWRFDGLAVQVGKSDLSGAADYREPARGADVPRIAAWHATLASRRIDLGELRAATRRAASTSPPGRMPPVAEAPPTIVRAPSASASTGAARTPSRLEATIDWTVQSIDGIPRGPLTALHLVGSIESEVWKASTLEFGFAGGRISGTAGFDTGVSPGALSLQARVDGVALERLGIRQAIGRIDARVALRSSGDTAEALLTGASGRITGALADASLPASLAAELGLDGGRWLRSLLDRSERSRVSCSAFDLALERGVARVRTLALETDALVLVGSGAIDLPARTLDLMLTPHRKQYSLLALDRSIRVHGPLRKPSIALADRVERGAPGRCPT